MGNQGENPDSQDVIQSNVNQHFKPQLCTITPPLPFPFIVTNTQDTLHMLQCRGYHQHYLQVSQMLTVS